MIVKIAFESASKSKQLQFSESSFMENTASARQLSKENNTNKNEKETEYLDESYEDGEETDQEIEED